MNFKRRQFLTARMFEADEAGNVIRRHENINPSELPPLVLAYIGDAYYHLFIREKLLFFNQSNVELLHTFAARLVSATWQAGVYHHLAPQLTEEEQEIFRRGRNAKSHVPKSATVADYRISTGLETLMGTLYLSGQHRRLQELVEAAFNFMAKEISVGGVGVVGDAVPKPLHGAPPLDPGRT